MRLLRDKFNSYLELIMLEVLGLELVTVLALVVVFAIKSMFVVKFQKVRIITYSLSNFNFFIPIRY
jgi:hypothetical protein